MCRLCRAGGWSCSTVASVIFFTPVMRFSSAFTLV
jgi:hypothetical protein